MAVTWTNKLDTNGQTNRAFKVRAWYDCDHDGEYDADEPHRLLYVDIPKVQLKVTHPVPPGSPTGSVPKYDHPTPTTGSADNLFATWDNEPLRIDVQIEPAELAASLPPGFITWSAAGFSIPDNTTNYTFTWPSTGTKDVTVNFPQCGITKKVYIDVPNVGALSQGQVALLLPPAVTLAIYANGYWAETYANSTYTACARRDAIRHAYWNALCVSDYPISQMQILLFSTGHEYGNKYTDKQQAFDSTMDLFNNFVGSTIHHSTSDGDPIDADILSDLNVKWANGDLWIWDGPGAESVSEGILLKSNGTKIY